MFCLLFQRLLGFANTTLKRGRLQQESRTEMQPGSFLGRSQVPTKFPHGFLVERRMSGSKWPRSLETMRVKPWRASGLYIKYDTSH